MAWKWYDRLAYNIKHRGSLDIAEDEGSEKKSDWYKHYFDNAYDNLETVRRGTDLLVDASSEIEVSIKGRIKNAVPRTLPNENSPKTNPVFIKQNLLESLLKFSPNPMEDVNQFRRQVFMDLVLTGNSYEYFDGFNLYHLPSKLVQVKTSKTKKIEKYVLNDKTEFKVHEIIHTRDNSAQSTVVGTTRLKASKDSMRILYKMLKFQDNFFERGAVPGLILTTPNALGNRIKQRLIAEWMRDYNPAKEGRKPLILDADLKPNPLSATNFKELDFENSVEKLEKKILTALGVPPILLDGGNNANIRPNLQLFYETTVLSLVAKHFSAYEAFFGYDLKADLVNVRALRPELREAGAYFQGLVNTGIMTINEARLELRLPKSPEPHADELRIPQNIAGSAENPTEGGRPSGDDNDDKGK